MTTNGAISGEMLKNFAGEFQKKPSYRMALNAISKTALPEVAMNRAAVASTDFTFSNVIKTGEITNQMSSGRCWMFAGLNLMRIKAMKKMNLATFELSQSYCFFWDKLEKSNYFLESVIKTAKDDVQSRVIMWLLQSLLSDGGQWDMFANIVKRYGVVPKTIMPETFNSSNSGHMNYLVTLKLREDAKILRDMAKKGAKESALRAKKEEMMSEIYRMLVIFLGEPPQQFQWQYRDKKDHFHREAKLMTPVEFYKKYVGIKLDDMVSLINCPTKDKPFNNMYTVKLLGNVVGGNIVRYLNVEMDVFKSAAIKSLKNNEAVWFGCDVGKMLNSPAGIMDAKLYDYNGVFDTNFGFDKAGRVDYCVSLMTHAMLFTGVNLLKDKPTKWKVENSWGDKNGEKGFYVMSDEWFNEYMYQIVVPKKNLPPKYQAMLKQKPIELQPWDPMGSLAMMY